MIDGHIHFNDQPYTLDTINKMVDIALKNNISDLYLLDHTHKFIEFYFLYSELTDKRSFELYNKKKNKMISINKYLDFIEEVKKHKYSVNLHFGLEVCYSKETENKLREELKKYSFDFLIGSVHFVNGFVIDVFDDIYKDYPVDMLYHDYFNEVICSIKSKLFTFIGHPDLVKRFDIYPSYDLTDDYIKVAKVLKEYNQETENNTGLLRYGYLYGGLNPKFESILKEYDVKFHKSSDAHKAEDIGRAFDTIDCNL